MRILVTFVLIVLGLAGDALAQSCASTQGQLEYCKALTNSVRFGFPRYTTALLPTCNTNNKGAVAFDTTTNEYKGCNGTAWAVIGGGSGDVTAVGDCASGACFDGTQGTTLTFNNAGGDATIAYDGTKFTLGKFPVVPVATGGEAAIGETGVQFGTAGTAIQLVGIDNNGLQLQSAAGALKTLIATEVKLYSAMGGNRLIYIAADSSPPQLGLASGVDLLWSSSATDGAGSKDTGLERESAGVVRITDGDDGFSYYQWKGQSIVGEDQTNATTTMAASTLSVNVTTGRRYSFTAILRFTDSVAADGAKFDFDASTATATDFRAFATGGAVTTGALAFISSTALATDFSYAVVDGAAQVTITGSFEPSASGTFAIQFAQAAHTTGTLTLHRGSSLIVFDMPYSPPS